VTLFFQRQLSFDGHHTPTGLKASFNVLHAFGVFGACPKLIRLDAFTTGKGQK
jgi:hypothetical protein